MTQDVTRYKGVVITIRPTIVGYTAMAGQRLHIVRASTRYGALHAARTVIDALDGADPTRFWVQASRVWERFNPDL